MEGVVTYLLNRGKGARRRRAHIAKFDAYGNIDGSWCGRYDFNLSSNIPWGCARCKNCIRKMNQ